MNESPKMNPQTGVYADVNGLQMYYELHGVGIPIILIHGGLATCQMWAPAIASLSENFQTITPDSRGHGRTNNPSGKFSYPLMAADIVAFIQAIGLQRPFVVGYSDGGHAALEMAMNYPGLARGYMIGAIYHSITEAWLQFMQASLGMDRPGDVNIERVVQTNPKFVRSVREQHDVFHTPDYWKTLLVQISTSWMTPPNYTKADFAKIVDPTLFWCGDRDVFCPPEQSLEMYRMANRAEVAIIPNADHFSMEHQFGVVNTVLKNFMMRIIKSD